MADEVTELLDRAAGALRAARLMDPAPAFACAHEALSQAQARCADGAAGAELATALRICAEAQASRDPKGHAFMTLACMHRAAALLGVEIAAAEV